MMENELKTRDEHIRNTALQMMSAARTAPKARGVDNLEIVLITDKTKNKLADKLEKLSAVKNHHFYIRDAGNIRQAGAVMLIGTRLGVMGLNCGFCGFKDCAEKEQHRYVPCVFNATDLGIAIGSAASKAADCRVDNRVLFSAADAALELGLLPECKVALAMLISVSGKNPFFDRAVVQTSSAK